MDPEAEVLSVSQKKVSSEALSGHFCSHNAAGTKRFMNILVYRSVTLCVVLTSSHASTSPLPCGAEALQRSVLH